MRLFAVSLLLASTSVIAAEVPLGKLPAGVTPTAYRLDLTVDPAKPTYSGHTEIDAQVAAPTGEVFLHGLGLKVARVTATAGGKTIVAKYSEVDPSGVARLDFASPLPAGPVTLKFDYTTGFRTGAEGLFRAKVGDDPLAQARKVKTVPFQSVFPDRDRRDQGRRCHRKGVTFARRQHLFVGRRPDGDMGIEQKRQSLTPSTARH